MGDWDAKRLFENISCSDFDRRMRRGGTFSDPLEKLSPAKLQLTEVKKMELEPGLFLEEEMLKMATFLHLRNSI
jgi:hypothetical protein